MKTILKQFIDEPLFDACAAMLDHLHISFNEVTRTPVSFDSLYPGSLSKALQEIVTKVEQTYFIGSIDESSLSGHQKQQSGTEITQQAAEGKYVGMMIFAVNIADGQSLSRTEMATLTRGFNRIAAAQPVVLFIKQGDRLALATCERSEYTQQWRDGEKLGKVSMLRNINCLHPHRGHLDILESIGDKGYPTFEELYKHWMQVFSSELLTKQFYNDLFEWYQWAVNPEIRVTFPGDVDTQDDDREDIDTRIIRLITRLMFVWFIKQKDLVPASIFDKDYVGTILKDFDAQSETEANYYQAILQNLFFGTLNRPIIEDGERREFAKAEKSDVKNLYRYAELFSISEDEVIELFSTVPFLNCGLFECQDKTKTLDGVERRFYYDGFSRNGRKKNGVFLYRAFVPNILFFHPTKGIISIFNKYVFTIEENTPQDVQIALEPELLGKVFENLLGAYNPETKETARNESGSFYTPREIVQYMVNESLVAHLKQTVGEELEQQYRQLLDFTTEEISLTTEQKASILHSLFTCKVLDPACGSGAFPMGMLQQMVHILQQVDPDNSQWRDVLLNIAVDESRRAFGIVDEEERKKKLLEIEETFNNGLNSPDYTRKLYIIESCIYGVDIQPIAMLISRLRFFITLICEQNDIQRDKPELNFGIKTLPNLESKFVAANSLINADIHQYNEDWTNDEVLALLKNELLAIRRRHFYTRKRSEKIRLLKEDEAKRKQIHEHINRLVGEPNEAKIALLQQQIADNEKLLEMYQGEDWVEEAVQKELFSEPEIVRIDRNKRERERISSVIAACRRDIEHEKNKFTPKGFEAAVLQVTDWNPYDQNSVSPFLDIEWMFGVTDGFDIVIGNPPYISTKDVKEKDKVSYEAQFGFSDDTYNLFTFRGLDLCKQFGTLNFITPKTFWTTQTKLNMRELILSKRIEYIFDTANPFDAVMVDTCITQVANADMPLYHTVKFLDGTKDLKHPIPLPLIRQDIFINSLHSIIFKPSKYNMQIHSQYGQVVKDLHEVFGDKIETSKKISKNSAFLTQYISQLAIGDITLLGCITDGGVGLQTSNNGKFVAVRRSTKWAKNIILSRPKKLAEAIKKHKVKVPQMTGFANEKKFLASLTDYEITELFDDLKEKYGRDIFGQGYIYRMIDDCELANISELSDDEMKNGIDASKNYYVPYDKGDKDGNRWYLETPFAIAWTKENVAFLKNNSGKKGEGMPVVRNPQFYFKEGFCWSDINTTYLKCRKKQKSIHDVKSMSLFGMTDKVPEDYIITLINSTFISLYVDNFVNNTQTFQINDARQLPIIIPTKEQIDIATGFVNEAIKIKKTTNSEKELLDLQQRVDRFVEQLYHINEQESNGDEYNGGMVLSL